MDFQELQTTEQSDKDSKYLKWLTHIKKKTHETRHHKTIIDIPDETTYKMISVDDKTINGWETRYWHGCKRILITWRL